MSPPQPYVIDPADPRAPSWEVWESLTPEQRRSVVDQLPAEVPFELFLPEGDPHRKAKSGAVSALDRFFRQIGRKVYVSSELAVYYPKEPRFAPDVLAVCDVEPTDRMKWVVADEGRGLDFVLEVHVAGDFAKDKNLNVSRYARLGIPEYFLFDGARAMLWGYRLPTPEARSYQPILAQTGKYHSQVLGLDLAIRQGRLRFYIGGAPLPEELELVDELQTLTDELVKRREAEQQQREAAEKRLDEERRQREAAEKQREAAEKRLDEERLQREALERRLAELEAELARLRRGGGRES
jgi:Uma2 family endonuclease